MKNASNKICVTQKGLQFLNQEKQQLYEQISKQQTLSGSISQKMSRTSSLPLLKSRSLLNQPRLVKQLSTLSKTKLKLQKIGLKSIHQKKVDNLIKQKLNEQFNESNNYVKSIIPHLVKMSKEKHQDIGLESRFERARMYVARLQQNFDTKFVFKPKRNPSETY